jgi:phage FluMu gp28-like protein
VSNPAVWAETLTRLEDKPLTLEPFQIRFLNDRAAFRILKKSRQTGLSTALAIETAWAATTRPGYNANIVSTTQDEAEDKIRIADLLWASIPEEYVAIGLKPVKWRNSTDALAFHAPPHTSTIISKPGTSAIRGGRKDMYYDEAAFIREFPKLWQAGLPAITRGEGRVTVISTPMGQSGLYYDLWNEPMFSHHDIPWWESRFMVRGALDAAEPYAVVAEACALAPDMTTEERVDRFGSEKIQQILHVGLRDDIIIFQTEYECMFVDEADAYFPLNLIRENIDPNIKVLKRWPEGKELKGDVSIGVDLAKAIDSTVFTVVETYEDNDGNQKRRIHYVEATQDEYAEQFKRLKRLVALTGARRVSLDATGPGQMFAEKAKAEGLGDRVHIEAISFTNAKKEKWATTFKGDLQTNSISFPDHPSLITQIHGVKRTRTENNFFKFAGVKDDYFWSACLGLYGEGTSPVRFHRL